MEIIKREFDRVIEKVEATETIDATMRGRLEVAFKFRVLAALEHIGGASETQP